MPRFFAVKHQLDDVIMNSRSGGAFTAFSDVVLAAGGSVYGAIVTSDMEIKHARATEIVNRDKMRGSKYVQSFVGETFRNVKVDLDNQKMVLFSGTSCQVAGLKKYLGKEYNNLLCIDIVCRGVASPKVWQKYIEWQEKCGKAKIKEVDFRNKKKFGWRSHVETLVYSNGKVRNSKVYATLYCSHNIYRPSCYKCQYTTLDRQGDITIADYWGVEKAAPEFSDNKGTSLVLVNSDKGEEFFNRVNSQLRWKETKMEDSLQVAFLHPCEKSKNRSTFWNDFQTKGFSQIAKKYGNYGFINFLKRQIKMLVKKAK